MCVFPSFFEIKYFFSNILTDKRNATIKIQAVISSNYVQIIQHKTLAFHVLEKSQTVDAVVQSNCRQPRPKFEVPYDKFEFEFQEDLVTLNDREG